jgi:HTH-type transcriptional regulator / antitoxin HigA
MTASQNHELDDLPLSPSGSADAISYYEAFLQGQELLSALPKNLRIGNSDQTLYGIVKELLAARSGGPTLFRRRADANEALMRFWLSKARATAQWTVVLNEIPSFVGLEREALLQFVKLSLDVDELRTLPDRLAEIGIVLLYEPSPQGTKVDGAAFRIESGNPVICLSLRHARLDIFWFTLLHELSHVALHFDRLNVPITDDLDFEGTDLVEQQADRLARDSLIPRHLWKSASVKFNQSETELLNFAKTAGVHPSVVAGRLRRDRNRHDIFSDMINSVNVRMVLLGHD